MLARHAHWCVLATALFGCSTDPPVAEPDALRASISDARGEGNAYIAIVQATTAMPAVFSEVERHHAQMVVILGDMDSYTSTLSGCMDTTALSSDRAGIIYELQMHVDMMGDMTSLWPARLEIYRHVDATDSLLDDMETVLDTGPCGH